MTRRTKPPELDPRRDPAWRWTLAGRENSVGITDRPARAARQYRRAWAACRTDADRRLLETRMPTHSAAHALYRDGRSRAALEVRVLSGEPAADIARKAGLPPSVVEAFEAVFFDVRSRLGATDFIHHVVIGAGTDEAAAWMALAYAGGPVVADALLGPGPAAARPQRPEDVPAFLEDAARAAARRLAAVASRNPTDEAARAAAARRHGPASPARPTHPGHAQRDPVGRRERRRAARGGPPGRGRFRRAARRATRPRTPPGVRRRGDPWTRGGDGRAPAPAPQGEEVGPPARRPAAAPAPAGRAAAARARRRPPQGQPADVRRQPRRPGAGGGRRGVADGAPRASPAAPAGAAGAPSRECLRPGRRNRVGAGPPRQRRRYSPRRAGHVRPARRAGRDRRAWAVRGLVRSAPAGAASARVAPPRPK